MTFRRTSAEQPHLPAGARPLRAPLALVLALLLALGAPLFTDAPVFAAPPAQASQIPHIVNAITLPSFASPLELAINQSTGEVYVSAENAGVVDAFEASGAPDPTHPQLTQANGTTPFHFSLPYGVAVDNTAGLDHGDVYAVDYSAGTISQFSPSGSRTATPATTAADLPAAGTAQAGGLPSVINNGGFSPTGVAVASDGDVYVSDQSNNVVDLFEPGGTFVAQVGAGHLESLYSLAVDSHGNLYIAEYGVGVIELNSSGTCVNSCTPIGGSSLGVAVDSEGNVYNDEIGTVAEFTSTGEPIDKFGSFEFGRGVAVNDANGDVYVADESGADVATFDPQPPNLPTIDETFSSDVTQSTATLAAQINPSSDPTAYRFQYGTTIAYGSSTLISESIGFDDTDHLVTADISGLVPGTTYHFRAVAIGPIGTIHGPDQTFTTPNPPPISGVSGSNTPSSTATLNTSAAEEPKRRSAVNCRQGFVKRHGRCVKRKSKTHHKSRRRHGRGGDT